MKQQQDVLAMDTFVRGKDCRSHLELSLVLAAEEVFMAETTCVSSHASISS